MCLFMKLKCNLQVPYIQICVVNVDHFTFLLLIIRILNKSGYYTYLVILSSIKDDAPRIFLLLCFKKTKKLLYYYQKPFSIKLIKIKNIQVLARTLQLAAQKSQAKTKKKNQRILIKRIKKKTKMARKQQPRSLLATLQMQ